MKQYLLVYRQSTGTLLELRELGEDVHAALKERFAVEHEWRNDRDVEDSPRPGANAAPFF